MGHEIVVARVYVWIYPIVALGRGGNFLASGARVAVRAHWSTFAEKKVTSLIGMMMAAAPLPIIASKDQ